MQFNTEKSRDSWFEEQGFTIEVSYHRNSPTSNVDDLRFDEFSKPINTNASVDVSYSYELVNGSWRLIDSAVYFDQLKVNVRTVEELMDAVGCLKRLFGR
jgi:hypothetical protein